MTSKRTVRTTAVHAVPIKHLTLLTQWPQMAALHTNSTPRDIIPLVAALQADPTFDAPPVAITYGADNHTIVIDGDKRVTAYRLAGRTTIPATLYTFADRAAAARFIASTHQRTRAC